MFQANFVRKQSAFETTPCVIEKVVELTKAEYLHFSRCMLENFDFIHKAAGELHHDENGVAHGMLVLGYGHNDGIFVVSEGYDYARYAAHIPDARSLLQAEMYPALTDFNRKMQELTEHHIQDALAMHSAGGYVLRDDTLSADLWDLNTGTSLLAEMLSQRPEVSDTETVDHDIVLTLAPEYIPADDTADLRMLTQDEVDIICAKHTLWLLGEGGEQADFANCLLDGLNLSHRNLNGAVFDGARLRGVDLTHSELCSAFCVETVFQECAMQDITAEEANFLDARFSGCEMRGAYLTHSDLSGVSFRNTSMQGGSIANCCLQNADLGSIRLDSVNAVGVSCDQEEWMEDFCKGPTMS